MAEKSRVRTMVDALSNAGLVIRGRLFESDGESVTVDADGVHYDVLVEHVTNAAEVAKATRGEPVEVRVSPEGRVVEKRLVGFGAGIPGVLTGGAFGTRPGGIIADDTECSYCNCDCTECSYCNCDECSYCTSTTWGGVGPGLRGGFARPFVRTRRFVRR